MLIQNLIRKIDGCANNAENSSTIKIGEHIPWGYSMSTIWAFDHIENRNTLFRRKDCMKKFCECLTEHARNTIYFEQKTEVIVKKRRTEITLRCQIMLGKNSLKIVC